MKLGFFLYGTGHHIASWRDPNVQADANRSLRHYIDITKTAERALFDFVFNADSNSSFGPDDQWRPGRLECGDLVIGVGGVQLQP